MKISIVIPTYNEAKNIEGLIKDILIVSSNHKIKTNIIVVDDNSPDGTSEVVKKFKENNPQVILIQRKGKLGLGTAYIKGIKYVLENLDSEINNDHGC